MDEIVGLAVRVTNKDLEAFMAEHKDMVEVESVGEIEGGAKESTSSENTSK